MAILSKGTTYADGGQITSTNLNALVDSATFATGAVAGNGVELNGSGQLEVRGNIDIGTSNLTATGTISLGATSATTLNTNGVVNLNLTTDSTSSTSGALIIDGGVGVAKKLFVGTDLDVDGTTNLDAVDIDGAVDMATTLAVAGDANFDSGTLFVDVSENRVGVGTTSPSVGLEVSATGVGLVVRNSNSSEVAGIATVRGQRSDTNASPAAAGGISLESFNTSGATVASEHLGSVYFGANHTAGSESNILGTASIAGVAEGTFSNATTMPSGIAFRTGSTGQAVGVYNTNVGAAERMRISSSGNVGISNTSPSSTLDVTGTLAVSGNVDFNGDLDVDGTTNLDAVDIDGAVQIDSTLTVGVNDTGHDVKFFGDTSGAYIQFDASADKLLTAGGATVDIVKDKLLIGGTAVTSTAAELNYNDTGAAVGNVVASKTVTVNSDKDVSGFRNITLTGELDAGSLDVSGDVDFGGIVTISDTTPIIRTSSNSEDLILRGGNTDAGGQIQLYGSTASSSGNDIRYFANEHEFWNTAVTKKIAFNDDEISFGTAQDVNLYRSGADTLKTDDSFEVAVNLDVDGTTNLDVVDIDGAVDMASTLAVGGHVGMASGNVTGKFAVGSAGVHPSIAFYNQNDAYFNGATTINGAAQFDSTLTVGVNDTGKDVKFFGATSGASMLWDESSDQMFLTGPDYQLKISDGSNQPFMLRVVGNAFRVHLNGTGDVLTATSSSVAIAGALSKGSGSFKIPHPLESKKDTHNLVHSFLEGPQADLLYRGRVDLVDGVASVNIDVASDMTDGTFVILCRDVQSFTTNESGWTAVRSSVDGNILTIEAQDNTCTDSISWMVVGERQDQHMHDTDWTDENGKVIVEPLIPEPTS